MKKIIITLSVAFLVAGCASVSNGLDSFTKGVNSLNKKLASGLPSSNKNGVSITREQELKIQSNLSVKTGDRQINQAILEASPVIEKFAKAESCINDYSDTSLDLYTAPGGTMNTSYAPMMSMKYHDRSKCLSVAKFQGWSMPAKNALKFEIIYVSDVSGETKKRYLEVVKQSNGEWLFTPQT